MREILPNRTVFSPRSTEVHFCMWLSSFNIPVSCVNWDRKLSELLSHTEFFRGVERGFNEFKQGVMVWSFRIFVTDKEAQVSQLPGFCSITAAKHPLLQLRFPIKKFKGQKRTFSLLPVLGNLLSVEPLDFLPINFFPKLCVNLPLLFLKCPHNTSKLKYFNHSFKTVLKSCLGYAFIPSLLQ